MFVTVFQEGMLYFLGKSKFDLIQGHGDRLSDS
jgi:hypothetical protein